MAIGLGTVTEAIGWYDQHGRGQYDNTQASRYDYAARVLSDRERFAASFVEQIGDDPGTILEIAAGTGIISQELHNCFGSANTVYTDLEDVPLQTLRQRIGQAAILRADFCQLPFADESFDTVAGVGAYRYVEPEAQKQFWSEIYRVIKPGGKAHIAQFYPRIFQLRGTDLAAEGLGHAEEFFKTQENRQWDAKAKLGPLTVKSGVYRSFAFTRE